MTNQKFNIFGSKWCIKYIDTLIKDNEGISFGECDNVKHTLTIATKDESNKNLDTDEIELTKIHEIIHAILVSGQYISCNNDEPLVEWLARCIYSLKKQKVL